MALDAKPNAAHYKLAEWEAQGKCRAVVTQNIDGLHQMAGSKNVLELHGSIHRNYCMRCGKFFDAAYVKNSEGAPKCDECGGLIKPDVVLYEEGLDVLKTKLGNLLPNNSVLFSALGKEQPIDISRKLSTELGVLLGSTALDDYLKNLVLKKQFEHGKLYISND